MISRRTRATLLAAAVSATLGASALRAAETPKQPILEEIVVTAQKREVSLQNVPFSVAAETADQIRASGAENLVDLSRNVTGLTIADLGPGQSQVAIRGVSAGQVIRDQPGVKPQVGVYLDESPISIALFTPDLDLFDLDRFEVLRGPQGTLFGSGSIAGTLRYITAQPKLGKTEGSVEASVSTVKGGSIGGDIKGALNLPVSDTAALRIVGYDDQLPGWITAYGPNGSIERDVNTGRKAGGRVALTWQPTAALSITPRLVYQDLTTNGFPRTDVWNILGNPDTTTQPTVPLGDRTQYRQIREGIDDNFRLGDLKIVYNFGPASLTSVSSYTDRDLLVTRDATQLTGSVTYSPFGGSGDQVRVSAPLLDATHLKAYAEELRVSSNGNGAVQWVVGGFFEHNRRHYGQDLYVPGYDALVESLAGNIGLTPAQAYLLGSAANGSPPDTPFYSQLEYTFKQSALFGEATYNFTDHLAATAGVRWFHFDEAKGIFFGGVFSNSAATPTTVYGDTSSSGAAPRLILSYAVNDDMKFNLQASRGFRLGGINDPINAPLCGQAAYDFYSQVPQKWKDEWAWNYELGAKMRFLDRRVSFDVAAFYTDIKDLQANINAAPCSSRLVANVPSARSAGIEAELAARPNENWDFALSGTWVDAKLTSDYILSGAPDATDGLTNGERLPTAPKFQSAAAITFTLPAAVAEKWDFYATAVGQYYGSSYSLFAYEPPGAGTFSVYGYGNPSISTFTINTELPAYHIVNLRAGFKGEGWDFAAYINNLTDESAYLAVDNERAFKARAAYLTNQPRTIGLALQKKF